jgi:type II secretory pathway component GspD/PulD (secretin)
MFRNSTLCAFVAVMLVTIGALSAYAQEPGTISDQNGFDPIIDEVLDQIEQGLDPQAAQGGSSSDIPAVTVGEDVPAGPESPDDVVEIPEIELEETVLPDPGIPEEGIDAREEGTESDIPLETETFHLEYVSAEDVLGRIETVLTNKIGQAHFDKKAGAVVVTDTPVVIGKIKELIRALDHVDRDVLIKAKILQIVLNDEHPQGVDWEAIVFDFQKKPFTGFEGKATDALSLGTISQEDYDILLDALDTVGVIRTVFEGDIKTENGTEADVRVLPDLSEDMQQSRDIRIRLVPDIKKGLAVEVSLWLELDGKSFAEEGGNQKGITVRAKDGATIIIGSLFEDVMVPSMWKIPLLGDLPLLGFVFRNEGEQLHKAEVITFLTVKTAEKRNGAEK